MAGSTESMARMQEMVDNHGPNGCPPGYVKDKDGNCVLMEKDPGFHKGPSRDEIKAIDPFFHKGPSGEEIKKIDPFFYKGPQRVIKPSALDSAILEMQQRKKQIFKP